MKNKSIQSKLLFKGLTFFAITFMLMSLLSCQNREKIVFITCCVKAKFFIPVRTGISMAAKQWGVDVDFIGTQGVNLEEQAQMIVDAVDSGADAIAVNLIDPQAFDAAVEYATSKGIPVVGFNVDDQNTDNARLSSVNQQLFKAGKTLGQAMHPLVQARLQKKRQKFLFTMHDKGISALEDRFHGLLAGLNLKADDVDLFITGSQSDESVSHLTNYLKQHPDIGFIFGTGQSDTQAISLAVEQMGQPGDYLAAGFDLSSITLNQIEKGFLYASVDQQPFIQGYFPVVQLVLKLRYGLQPSNIDAGASLIRQPEVKLLKKLAKKGFR